MEPTRDNDTDTDIALRDSLALLGETPPADASTIQYGDLVLATAPKEGKANTLLAAHLFSPALLLAERIERGLINFPGQTVVELGAGCALPSLLAATLPTDAPPPALVVVTDHPAPEILTSLAANVRRNMHLVREGCRVVMRAFEWGTDAAGVLETLPEQGRTQGFDAVILSDLLHFSSSHGDLVNALFALLARHADARVYVAAGKYTPQHVCDAFLAAAAGRGLAWAEGSSDDAGTWRGTRKVGGLGAAELGARKENCWWWVGRWRANA